MFRRREFKGPLHIALAFPLAQAHLLSLTQGITTFAKNHARWILTTGGEAGTLSIEQLKGWRGHGIIAALIRPSEAQMARRFLRGGVPVVTIAGALQHPGVPRVTVSNPEIGRMAADHLFKSGYRHFAFYGLRRVAYSVDRQAGFTARLGELGLACEGHFSPGTYGLRRPWQDDVGNLRRWMARLARPAGIFAVNDFRARLLIDACELAELHVPGQIGILGVDNDRMICEFSEPGLSSIECDWQRVGFEAAQTLHRMMQGQAPEAEQRIAPREVIRRASTTVAVANDPRLHKVITYIHEHLEEVFGVERLLEAGDVSRRTLEQIFRTELRMTPYQYLSRRRIERAKMLLQSDPSAKLKQISRLCGFRDSPRFRHVFMRMEGKTPAAYCRELRLNAG